MNLASLARTGLFDPLLAVVDLGSNTENLLRLAPCNVLLTGGTFYPPLDVKAEEIISWTEEAEARMERVPPQVKGVARISRVRDCERPTVRADGHRLGSVESVRAADAVTPERGDKRFLDPEWGKNAFFDFLKQTYLVTARGMTVFARVDFGRHILAWVAGHKLKQALRPEMWML